MKYRGQKLLDAIEHRHQAINHVYTVVQELWPPGSAVAWIHEGRLCTGKVHRILFGEQLMAVEDGSGAFRVVRGSAIAAAAGYN